MGNMRVPIGWWTALFVLLGTELATATMEDASSCSCISIATAAAVIAAVLCLAVVGAVVFLRRRRAEPRRKEDLEAAERAAYVNPNFKDDTTGDESHVAATALSADGTSHSLGRANGGPWAFKAAREDQAVPLRATDFAGLGFTVCGSLKAGVFVRDVLSSGPAALSGRVKAGDRLLALTVEMESCALEDAQSLLSSASPYPVVLHLHRPSSTKPSTARSDPPPKRGEDRGEATPPTFKSSSSGDLTQVSPTTRTRPRGLEEESLGGHPENPITRISDSAIDQLVDSKLSRDSKQGRHSERAIDVPDSALKTSSVYGDPHASSSERAIDVSESSKKPSSVYGELQTSSSERAIDVSESSKKSSSVYGELQTCSSERAIDVSESSSKKPSSGYGELQTSLSERAIDGPETQSSSGLKELQSSLSERAIDVPDSLLRSSDHRELHYSLSDRALDVPAAKLKPASAFGELPSSSLHDTMKFSSGDIPTECGDKVHKSKIVEESSDDIKDTSLSENDSSSRENGRPPSTSGNETQKVEDCSSISGSHKFHLSSVKNTDENAEDDSLDVPPRRDSYTHDSQESGATNDEVTVAEYSISSSHADATPEIDSSFETAKSSSETAKGSTETAKSSSETAKSSSETAKGSTETAKSSSETVKGSSEIAKSSSEIAKGSTETAKSSSVAIDAEKIGRHDADSTHEVEHLTDSEPETHHRDQDEEEMDVVKASQDYHSAHHRFELSEPQDEANYLDAERLHEDRSEIKEKIAIESEENDAFGKESVESAGDNGDSDDNETDISKKSTEVIRIISAVPNVPLGETQSSQSTSVEADSRDAEKSIRPSFEDEVTEDKQGRISETVRSFSSGSRDIRAHVEESQFTGSNISGANAAKVAAASRVSSPNDRSNIFGMYVNHDFNEAANEGRLSASGRGFEVVVDENTDIELKSPAHVLKNAQGKDNQGLLKREIDSAERGAEHSNDKTGKLQGTSEEDYDKPIVKSERKISLFSFDISKPKKTTFELRMASSDNPQETDPNSKALDAATEESDTSELSVTENDLPEVDTYLTEISPVVHELPKERHFEGLLEAESDSPAPAADRDFGTVFGFTGFKKHIPRSDTSRSDVRECDEVEPPKVTETTEKAPVSKINSVSVLRMNFESSFDIQPSDDDETSLSSFNRHYLPESEAYLPSNPIRIETNFPGSTIEISGSSGDREKDIGLKSGGSAVETLPRDDELEAEAESSIRIPRARHSLYQRANEIGNFSNSRGQVFGDSTTNYDSESEKITYRSETQPQDMSHLMNTSDSDSDAMIMAAEVAVAHRKRKPGHNMGSSILIKTDANSTVSGESPNSGMKTPAMFSPDPVTVTNSVVHKQTTRVRRPLSNPGITFGRIIGNPGEIRFDNLKQNFQKDNVYIVSNFNPQQADSVTRTNEGSVIGSASEVTVVSNEKYVSDSDEMKKRAASLDDLSYIPNRTDDALLERAMSLEFKLAHGDEKNSFRTRRNNLPRSSTSMREVERSSMISVDNLLDKDRDHSPPQNRRSDLPSKGHSHSVFVQSYRRDQRATSLEGIPSSLTRSNSSKLAVHQSNVTVRSNPTLSLSTHNISPTNLKVNYDSAGVELDEQRGGIVSNIEISGDRGVSITSLTHSSPWPSTSSETDHLSSFEQSPPHSSIHSPSEMIGTTTIQVLEAPMEPLNYLSDNLGKGIEVSDVYRNQYLSLKTNGLESDAEDEVTVTTGDASFFTGPGDHLNESRSNEWTHVNGNMRSIEDDFSYPDDFQADFQDGYQTSTGDHPEKTLLTSMTQIRVLGERNKAQNDK